MEPKRILIVEDEKDLSDTLKMTFEMQGHKVKTARSPKKALATCHEFDVQVALIDIRLGAESGLDLIPQLKAILPRMLCVIMTAYAETELAIQAMHKGAYDFLRKPIDIAHLRVIFNRCFEQVQSEQEKLEAQETLRQRNAELEQANRQMRESQRNLQTFFDTLEDFLFIVDLSGKLLKINPVVSMSLGYPMDVLTDGMDFFDIITPDSQPQVEELFSNLDRLQKEPQAWKLQSKFHTFVPIEIKFSEGTWEGQNVLFAIARDVALRIQAEEAVKQNEIRSYQSQKLEAIGTLAGGIAHDFNNILQGIIMTTELLRVPAVRDKMEEHLDQIIRFSKRGAELVSQILAFSRQNTLQQKPLKLQPIVGEVLKMMRSTLPSSLNIRHDIDPNCQKIQGNSTQLYQVIVNLCTNAGYAMRQHGGELVLVLQEAEVDESFADKIHVRPGKYLKLTVTDSGHGIPDDIQSRIFDPFFTTKPTGDGTGMGLAVVHGIVRSHNGAIHVESELEQYTTFTIFLPIFQKESPPIVQEPRPLEDRGNETILLVDDEVEVSQVMAKNLENLGYSVEVQNDSKAALERFRIAPARYDLLIIDQTMPNLSGDLLADELRAIRPNLPIIIASGFSQLLISPEKLTQKQITMVSKPLEVAHLNRIIRETMNQMKAGHAS